MKSLEWTATVNAVGEWNAIWITKADIGWISWGSLSELIRVLEKTVFGVKDGDKNMLFHLRKGSGMIWQAERLKYFYGLFFEKTLEHTLKMGLFQIAIRSWLFVYSSLSYLRIWTQSIVCVWEPGEPSLLRQLLAIICEWQLLEMLIRLMH